MIRRFVRPVSMALALAACFSVAGFARAENYGAQLTISPADFRTAEYNWSYALAAVNAADSYSRRWNGGWQNVAVFDTGISGGNAEFHGQILAQYDLYAGRERQMPDNVGHGTFVSGIIAAKKDGIGMHGLAFNSKILAIKIANDSGALAFNNNQMARAIRYALSKKSRIFNNSWNSTAFVTAFTKAQLNGGLGTMLQAYREAVRANAIVVFAAGNEGGAHPGLYASLPYYFPELKNGWIAAVATGADGRIASYSNRCGHASWWCMAAPGSDLISTLGGGYGIGSGTSFATPMISAAVAILKQRWPHLNNAQIRSILFKTANKSGIYSDWRLYGQGMLDIGKATGPLGTLSAPVGKGVAAKVSLASTAISLGGTSAGLKMKTGGLQTIVLDEFDRDFDVDAQSLFESAAPHFDSAAALAGFGNGLTLFSNQEESGRGLTLGFAESPDARHLLPGAQLNGAQLFFNVEGRDYGFTSAFNITPAAFFSSAPQDLMFDARAIEPDALGNAYLGYVKNPVTLAAKANLSHGFYSKGGAFFGDIENDPAATLTTGDDPNLANRSSGIWGSVAEIGYGLGKKSTLAVTGGTVMEKGTLLGAASSGAAALSDQAMTGFIGLSAKLDLGEGVTAFGGYDMGWTKADAASNSLIRDVGTISSSAFRLGFVKTGVAGKDDQFGLVLSQPLRIDSGSVGLSLPTARDESGAISHLNTSADLSSTARALDWQAFYQTKIDDDSSIASGLLLRQNSGQREGNNEAVLLSRYRLAF
jgi:hypothetical protein